MEGTPSHVDAGDRVDKYRRLTRVRAVGSGYLMGEWRVGRLIGRAAGVLWTSKVVLLQIPAGHGNLLLRVAASKGKSRFSGASVASADIAVMGRVQDMGRGRIGV